MTTHEDMRKALVADLKDLLGDDVQVVRGSIDVEVNYPLVVVRFGGYTRILHGNGLTRSTDGTRDNWTMEELCTISIYTQEAIDGEDTSRSDLQDYLDDIEYHVRKEWPAILKEYDCAIWYPGSYYSSFRDTFYNENRLNEAVLRISLQEPRLGPDAEIEEGPDPERIDVESQEVTADNAVSIIIEDE